MGLPCLRVFCIYEQGIICGVFEGLIICQHHSSLLPGCYEALVGIWGFIIRLQEAGRVFKSELGSCLMAFVSCGSLRVVRLFGSFFRFLGTLTFRASEGIVAS